MPGRFAASGVEFIGLVELSLDFFRLRFQVVRLDLERLLVDVAGQVAVEQPVLHVHQLGAALGQNAILLGLDGADFAEGGLQRVAEPSGVALRQSHAGQFLLDGVVDLTLAPPNLRMPVVGVVVAALVVDVLVAAAIFQLAADQFARHGEVAAGATEDAAGESDVRVAGAPVAPVKDVLADIEHLAVDEQSVAALEGPAVSF